MNTKNSVLTRLLDKGHTSREIAADLDLHANTFTRMQAQEELSRRDQYALLYLEQLYAKNATVVRSGPSCVGTTDSPLVEVTIDVINARWRIRLASHLRGTPFEGLALGQTRVRFEHATSDAERVEELLNDQTIPGRRWVMKMLLHGEWEPIQYDHILDEDIAKLGILPEDLKKPLDVWRFEALTRSGWRVLGHYAGDDYATAYESVHNDMMSMGRSLFQTRSQRLA